METSLSLHPHTVPSTCKGCPESQENTMEESTLLKYCDKPWGEAKKQSRLTFQHHQESGGFL